MSSLTAEIIKAAEQVSLPWCLGGVEDNLMDQIKTKSEGTENFIHSSSDPLVKSGLSRAESCRDL